MKSILLRRYIAKKWPLRNKYRIAKWLLNPNKYQFNEISHLDNNLLLKTSNMSYIEWMVWSTGTYEPENNHLFNVFIKPGSVCLDIGANIGINTLRMAKLSGEKGHVHCFEPIDETATKLKYNIALNALNNCTIHQVALSNKSETIKVKYPLDYGFNYGAISLAYTDEKTYKEVKVLVGDEYLDQLQLSKLDFIKIDVEGYEWPVLQGIENAVDKFKPHILFEFMQKGPNQYLNINVEDVFKYFKSKGYQLFAVEDLGLIEISQPENFPDTGNVFAINL